MSRLKLLLPDSIDLSPDLPDDVEAVIYPARGPIPDEHLDAEVLVAWDNGRRLLQQATTMPRLRLVQGLMAGTDLIVAAGFGPEVAICSGVGLHDATVTEHAMALCLALVRRIPLSLRAQAEHRWAIEIAGNRPFREEGPVTSLIGARVLIWGFGSIGQTLAPLLASMGATVTGAATTAGERGGFTVVDDEGLADELARTDLLVMVLPSAESTADALNAERIGQLKKDAYVVNVGRGATLDEDALIAALKSGHIAGAALDVMKTEPLPAESPLWEAPNILLTPHNAGGRPVGADELISANIAALLGGDQLRNLVDR